MQFSSNIEVIGSVSFPAWTGERVYMKEFTKAGGLPPNLQRWQPTVDAMLAGVDAPGPIYIMIDQGAVTPEASHRRGGVHIDGYWCAATQAHRGGGSHVGNGSWDNGRTGWSHCDFSRPEAIILASDVQAACGYTGTWTGTPGQGGDCSHIDVTTLAKVPMLAGVAYAGNVAMLHESLPTHRHMQRTLVRLNIPGCTTAH